MTEFAIFAICGLLAIVASLISIYMNEGSADQIVADYWWWQLPM